MTNGSSTPQNKSPFAARASTRPPMPEAGTAPFAGAAAAKQRRAPWIVAVAAALAATAGGAVWWALRTDRAPAPVASAMASRPAPSAPTKVKVPEESPAAREARMAKAFADVQALATGLEFGDEARRKLAEATLLAAGAGARRGAGDAAGAAEEWAKALAGAGPVVLEAVVARYEWEAGALRQLRLEDQAAPAAQALRDALGASEEAAARGEWAEAVAKREEARGMLGGAKKAIAAQFAGAASGAAGRGDPAMATLLHERALRLDDALSSSRDYLYRNKFKPGQLLRTAGGVELAYAPPGEFLRGSPVSEPGRDADETPQRVTLTKGFFLATTETTQREWDRVMGTGAALRTLRAAKAKAELISPEMPMHSVTWEQAAEYCRRLSELEGMAFRLPTEAEWEYACRAGTGTAFNLGSDGLSAREANIDDGTAGAPLAPRPPGSFGRPNVWGLRDMHGNLWEWCADWSAPYAAASSLRDPSGPGPEGLGRIDLAMKVVRGGGWNAPANDARSANRWEYAPAVATAYIGLRVAHDPDLARQ